MSEDQASETIEAAEASIDIATSLLAMAEAGEKLLASGLTQEALVVLLQHKTRMPMRDIRAVLYAIPDLRDYVSQ